MLLYIFLSFLTGFLLSLRFVRNPTKAFIWGAALGGLPLVLLLGPANAPVQGIGSALNFAFFALGRIMLIPFVASGAALGMAGASIVLWVGKKQPKWAQWATGIAILGLTASLTLWPVAQREMTKRQLAEGRKIRVAEVIRASFTGTFAGHQVAFPASPHLSVFEDCASGVKKMKTQCSTILRNPVSILTNLNEVPLHERRDPLSFKIISISSLEQDCRPGNDYCLTQEKVDHWCREIRPDQAESIWCQDTPANSFAFKTEVKRGPSDRNEPELAARYADTVLGPAQISCFYSPDPEETHRQGAGCGFAFNVADGVSAVFGARREQIISGDPMLSLTINAIPDYWSSLTEKR